MVTPKGNGNYIRSLYIPNIPLLVGGGPTQLVFLLYAQGCYGIWVNDGSAAVTVLVSDMSYSLSSLKGVI